MTEALKVNSVAVQELDVYYNYISGAGGKALADGLKVDTAVKKLNLDTFKVSDSVKQQVRTRLSRRS